ncbi:hypothetical protein [Nonomuraea sp. JJY05]|jgi:hypothetical protein|uniref:hypothetical protein n=1 Tax=Nonomuraea sp. JJY05 TaxID=3350255 RepID=UPI00373F5604
MRFLLLLPLLALPPVTAAQAPGTIVVAALGEPADNTPRIVYVKGAIDADTSADGTPLICSDAFDGIAAEKVLSVFNGTAITAKGSLVDGAPADVVAAYNAAHGTAVGPDAGWTPALFTRVHPPQALRSLVPAKAGAGRLR